MIGPAENARQRLTWDPRGPAPYESTWSVLLKIAALNSLSAAELHGLLSSDPARRTDGNFLWPAIGAQELKVVAQLMRVAEWRLRTGSLPALGFGNGISIAYAPRHCPECFQLGYHCSLFDLPFVAVCPWHSKRLSRGCSVCARALGSTSSSHLRNTSRWDCRACGVYFDFHRHPVVNRIDAKAEMEIQALGDELTAWWTDFCRRSRDSHVLALPLLYDRREEFSLHNIWRLGFVEALASHPEHWTFTERPLPTHTVAPIQVGESTRTSAKLISLCEADYQAFKSVRRALFRRFLTRHRKCLAELTHLGIFERSALDSQRVCSVSVAWISWLMAHECKELKTFQGTQSEFGADAPEIHVGEYDPDSPLAELYLAHANFYRIWGAIEALIPTRAVRVCVVKAQDRTCDLPHRIIRGSGADAVELLVPNRAILEQCAQVRCVQRSRARLPMYQASAAYANSGWNAMPDMHTPFTIRNYGDGIRNTYWHLEV